jgi:competence protein ComEC
MQKPIIPVTIAYILGILLGHGFLYFPYSISILIVISILIASTFIRSRTGTRYRAVLILLPAFIGVSAYLYSSAWLPSDHYTRLFLPGKSLHEMTGTIISPLDRDADRTGFVLKLATIDGTPVSGKIRVSVREELTAVGYGDTILIVGKLFKPRGFNNPGGFDYTAHLARNGIYSTVSVKNAETIKILLRGTGVFRTIQDWRERIRQSFLAATTGHGSAVLQAMTLGEEGRLTDELRDQFMAAGVTHIISISGSHLGMVAILCFTLIRGLMLLLPERYYHGLSIHVDPKKIAALLTLPLVVFYTLLAGGQVATVRSLIMISAGLFALILDRENALNHSLAIAALVILIASPQALFDISFQLSYLSVLVIGAVVTIWIDMNISTRSFFQTLRNNVILLTTISFATSLATGPLVAHYFNQLSFAGIISNIVVVPFAGMVIVPLGLFSGILSLFTYHLPLADLNQFLSDLFVKSVAFFARLPFAEFHPPAPGLPWLMCYAFFLFTLAAFAGNRLRARFKPFEYPSRLPKLHIAGLMLSGTVVSFSLVLSIAARSGTVISFPDVGQGDCTVLELASGKTVLIDGGGTADDRFDIGRRVIAPYLWNRGIRGLDLVILSHPHPDHMNGLRSLLRAFNTREVWDSGLDTSLPGYDEFLKVTAAKKITRRTVSANDPPTILDDTTLKVIHPPRGFHDHQSRAYAAENNRSLVVKVQSEGKALLFTGDIGVYAEENLVRSMRGLRCNLLKVPHHGSKGSSSDAFVEHTNPQIAIVTVGRENPYHHPSDVTLSQYEKIGSQLYRTDRDGAVMVRLRNNRFDVVCWSDLIMKRIVLNESSNWREKEKSNWKALGIRATAF